MTTLRILGVSGGVSDPSRTTTLVREVLREIEALTGSSSQLIEIANVAPIVGAYAAREQLPAEGEALLGTIESADLIVAGSPVYKGAYTGLFKHLFDMLDPNALADVPVVLAATGRTDRHALTIDHTLRPLFSFFRAHTVPTPLYAHAEHFRDGEIIDQGLRQRIQVAARQAVHLLGAPARGRRAIAASRSLAAQ